MLTTEALIAEIPEKKEAPTEGSQPGTCASNATGTFYWKQIDGGTLAESDLGGNPTAVYGPVRGQIYHRVDISGSTYSPHYYFHDFLRSTNLVVNSSNTILQETDYYPYGGEIPIISGDSNRYRFTGKEHDAETGLDFFGARHYASTMGRFMTPDPGNIRIKHLLDPQGLNRYPYARDNPLRYVDPDGKDWETAWNDLKSFANSVYIKATNGVGVEASAKVGSSGEVKIGAAFKGSIETSQDSVLTVSKSVDIGASAGLKDSPARAGEGVSASQTVLTVHNDGSVTGAEPAKGEITDSIGGNTTINPSDDRIGIGVELGAVAVGGGEIGATRQGWAALVDAAHMLFRTGNEYPLAIRLVRRYLSSGTKVEEYPVFKAQYLLGELLEKQGDASAAAGEYRDAIALARNFRPAQDALKRVTR